jgi:hypothetical protein
MTFEEFLRSQGTSKNQLGPNRLDAMRQQFQRSGQTSTADPTNGFGIGGVPWATISANAAAHNAGSPYTSGGGGGGEPPVEWTPADTTQNWINENPYEYMQGKLQGSGLMSPTGGTSFDTWLTNSYMPRLMGGYYQEMSKDAQRNLGGVAGTTLNAGAPTPISNGINKAQARRMFLHRPDAERMPNPFAAGPGRWSMWD